MEGGVRACRRILLIGWLVVMVCILLSTTNAFAASEVEPNDKRDNATQITVNSAVEGNLQSWGDHDYYRLNLSADGALTVKIDHLLSEEKYWELRVYQSGGDGRLYWSRTDYGKSQTTFSTLGLSAGTYYLAIYCSGLSFNYSDHPYMLTAVFEPTDSWEKEPNEKRDLSTDLPIGKTMHGNLNEGGDKDYYRLTLPKDARVNFRLGHASLEEKYWDVYLYQSGDSSRLYKFRSNYGATMTVSDVLDLTAGTYYVLVHNNWGSNSYWPHDDYSITAIASYTGRFSDVYSTDWFFESVEKASNNGYVNGYAGSDNFGPGNTLTRAQAASILFSMAGSAASGWTNTATQFSDVPAHEWYAKSISFCSSKGIVNGYSDTDRFGPNDILTREQFAVMLSSYAKYLNRYSRVSTTVLDKYNDKGSVSSWASEGVAWAVKNQVIGKDSNVLNPHNAVSRAEAATMAVRYQPNRR